MSQKRATHYGSEPNPLDTTRLCLLSLDGGGVRGLSTLYILKGIMTRLNSRRKDAGLPAVKPCEVFDLIGGTSTGGLIAIMLGRLEMDVDECIAAYTELMKAIFVKASSQLPITWKGKVKPRFNSAKLKDAIEDVVSSRGALPADAFDDGKDRRCRTFVCATAKETAGITRLRSYSLPDESNIPATISQAALATSAATGFFDPVSVGARQFVDGALGANNPVDEVEGEAANIWSRGTGDPKPLVKCFVSIGTGNPGKKALKDNMLGFFSKTLVRIATETEVTERKFVARWAQHLDEKRFFRFNVDQGLQDVGLAEHREQGRMEAVTDEYLKHQDQKFRLRDCVLNLEQKGSQAPFSSIDGEYQPRYIRQNDTKRLPSLPSDAENSIATGKVHYIPFSKNRYFVGRRDELAELKQKLMVDQDCQKISIVGLGGTGKTQIALQFAYMVKETWPEFSVFWLPATNMESFEQACTEVVKALRIQTSKEEDQKVVVMQYLSAASTRQRWLLVLDNADDRDIVLGTAHSKGIIDYLPESDQGMTVYTTRTQEMAVSLTRADILELGPMGQQDAEDFLKKSLFKKELLTDSKAMAELLDELAYLPLAIRQATAYLNRNKTPSIAKYLRLLRNTEQDLVSLISKEFRDDTRYKDSGNAVATTWVVSFSQIHEHNTLAAELLVFMSFIEWKAIPRSLLPNVQSEEQLEEAIGTLHGYSFLTIREVDCQMGDYSREEWYDMHRLVHLATRIWASRHKDIAKKSRKALRHITRVFPSHAFENRSVWRAYLPHAMRILGSMQSYFEMESELSLLVGRCLYADGRVREAVTWLEESYQMRKDNLKEDNPDRLDSQHELAGAYIDDGQVKKAITLLEHIINVKKRILTEKDSSQLASQHELAGAYIDDGQVKKAITLLEHVVKIEEEVLAEEDSSRLMSQHELARAYLTDGQVKKAVTLLEYVITMQKEALDKEHPSQLDSQYTLAIAYKEDGQVKKAIALLEHVVAVESRVLRDDHPDRLRSIEVLEDMYANLEVDSDSV